MTAGYDIIGDVHGHDDALRALLAKLGYAERGGAFRHAERTAVFIGDLVDRGPGQLATIRMARSMRDAGTAHVLMGNHEFNAVAFATPDPTRPGEFLRPHHHAKYGARNREQHAAFLSEVEHDPALYREIVAWFLTLPLWLRLPSRDDAAIRLAHACWHRDHLRALRHRLGPSACLTAELMPEAMGRVEPAGTLLGASLAVPGASFGAQGQTLGSPGPTLSESVEIVLKGPELRLPAGVDFRDSYGTARRRVRQCWWRRDATTLRDAAIVDDGVRARLPAAALPRSARVPFPRRKPVFIGHYGFTEAPHLLATNVACVDWGAGKGVRLCAYRWSGEAALDAANFCCVDAGHAG